MHQAASFRLADADDAEAIAHLHAESWRRNYRGAYSDAFLDGDVVADRLAVWSELLAEPDPRRHTLVAEDGLLVGFANTLFDHDREWGALLDNLHVTGEHKRRGIGSRLLSMTAHAVIARPQGSGLYLWVLEQNVDAQAFYGARGGECVERRATEPPGGVASRLTGTPTKLRYAWRDPTVLLG